MTTFASSTHCRRRGRGAGRILETILCLVSIAAPLIFSGCGDKSLRKSSQGYGDAVSAFYIGLGALQVGDDVHADAMFARFTELAPSEPAGWANWGALALRQRKLDVAAERFERARKLAPDNSHIYQLLGLLESGRGDSPKAIADWRKAVELNPRNYRAAYQLAEEVERQGGADSETEYQSLLQKILAAEPDNLAAELEFARVAAKRGDRAALKQSLAQIAGRSASWPPEVKEQWDVLQTAADGPDPRAAAPRTTFLRNTLMRVPEFRESLAVLKAPAGEEAEPFSHFLRMDPPDFTPAPADTALAFTAEPATKNGEAASSAWIAAVALGSAGSPVIAQADGREVHLSSGASFPFPGGKIAITPLPEGILQLDFNYDFKQTSSLRAPAGCA